MRWGLAGSGSGFLLFDGVALAGSLPVRAATAENKLANYADTGKWAKKQTSAACISIIYSEVGGVGGGVGEAGQT